MREMRNRRRAAAPKSLAQSLRIQLELDLQQRALIQFPCVQYQQNIEGFCRDILGIQVTRKQRQIFAMCQRMISPDAAIRRGAIKSCVKSGKTFTMAILALHRYACWIDSRTILTAPSERSVQRLCWRELKRMHARSGCCYACKQLGKTACEHSAKIPGECSPEARTGLRGLGFAEVFGVVANQEDTLAGFSDPHLTILGDEANGYRDDYATALRANMTSSVTGYELWISNPRRKTGWYHKAFESKTWELLTISAFDVCDEGIPGLATRKTIADYADDYGEDSDTYRIYVLGEFPASEIGGLFSDAFMQAAIERWKQSREGAFVIGCDPATSETNDGCGFAVRRGLSIQRIAVEYGLTLDAIWQYILGLVQDYGDGKEPVALVIDTMGLGYELVQLIRPHLKNTPIQLIQVRSSDKALRKPQTYDRIREELVESFRMFVRDGSLPPGECDALVEEAQCFGFSEGKMGLLKATDKRLIRRQLGRSPDAFDAACLCAWPTSVTPKRTRPAPRVGGSANGVPRGVAAAGAMAAMQQRTAPRGIPRY